MLKLTEIQIRDPFVLTDRQNQCYYLYGSTDRDIWNTGISFQGYRSTNLVDFDGPYTLFENTPNFWAEKNFWAPEVHYYQGKYYMFASFYSRKLGRGTQILSCDEPLGRYTPTSPIPATPPGWTCLDGTLHVDSEGDPWIVFCREWVEVYDGEIWCQRLSEDLTASVGEPELLFRASQSGWADYSRKRFRKNYVTDGPFVYTTKTGRLLLLWSSFRNGKYAIGLARPENNKINGKYEHLGCLYEDDGGHGMVFADLEGRLRLAIHTPNASPRERTVFLSLRDAGETLVVE